MNTIDRLKAIDERVNSESREQKRKVFNAMKRNGLEHAAIEAGKLAAALGTQVDAVRVTENDGTVTQWRK